MIVTAMTIGTKTLKSHPNAIPVLRTKVVNASVKLAVTGPRSKNFNNRVLTTLSDQVTPKNAVAYAINIINAPTNILLIIAIIQNPFGFLLAIPDPKSKKGNEPRAGAKAPITK